MCSIEKINQRKGIYVSEYHGSTNSVPWNVKLNTLVWMNWIMCYVYKDKIAESMYIWSAI